MIIGAKPSNAQDLVGYAKQVFVIVERQTLFIILHYESNRHFMTLDRLRKQWLCISARSLLVMR